ncbi:META domain-containing protein [Jannaschia sp. M317]|uniref:META domain-containing protein n=1 Tax=Jannaschia sp. M317 TaxID=2867011 RepID=UPI0021A76F41|nr:META domain-containing protein [Jannaschia sp. M317]UWQ17383.1 META domain-containing protein [Jannaschia sp. M317]
MLCSVAFFFGLAWFCPDETISGYAIAATYHLTEMNGAAFAGTATIAFPEPGIVTGQAPCNRYTASQSVPYPWVEIGPIAATRMACPALDAEAEFLAALGEVTLAEVQGPVLILSDNDGPRMVFEAR